MPYTMKRGDTFPPLALTVTENALPLDLTAAVADAAAGEIEYEWQAGDTDTSGEYNLEVEIEWAAGGFQTVPNAEYDSLTIMDDLGGTV